MAADNLATQGAKASAALVLIYFSGNIPAAALQGLVRVLKSINRVSSFVSNRHFRYLFIMIYNTPCNKSYSISVGMQMTRCM